LVEWIIQLVQEFQVHLVNLVCSVVLLDYQQQCLGTEILDMIILISSILEIAAISSSGFLSTNHWLVPLSLRPLNLDLLGNAKIPRMVFPAAP
jgi:hypothetical protein